MVLSRVKDESIIIGDGSFRIVIKVVSFDGRKVRIGIDAPQHIEVNRAEIQELIDDERKYNDRTP